MGEDRVSFDSFGSCRVILTIRGQPHITTTTTITTSNRGAPGKWSIADKDIFKRIIRSRIRERELINNNR